MFQTVRFKNELERNITIKLGYANAKVIGNGFTEQESWLENYLIKTDRDPADQGNQEKFENFPIREK